jgi:hypothetical protein
MPPSLWLFGRFFVHFVLSRRCSITQVVKEHRRDRLVVGSAGLVLSSAPCPAVVCDVARSRIKYFGLNFGPVRRSAVVSNWGYTTSRCTCSSPWVFFCSKAPVEKKSQLKEMNEEHTDETTGLGQTSALKSMCHDVCTSTGIQGRPHVEDLQTWRFWKRGYVFRPRVWAFFFQASQPSLPSRVWSVFPAVCSVPFHGGQLSLSSRWSSHAPHRTRFRPHLPFGAPLVAKNLLARQATSRFCKGKNPRKSKELLCSLLGLFVVTRHTRRTVNRGPSLCPLLSMCEPSSTC